MLRARKHAPVGAHTRDTAERTRHPPDVEEVRMHHRLAAHQHDRQRLDQGEILKQCPVLRQRQRCTPFLRSL